MCIYIFVYRHAEVAGEMGIGETPAADIGHEIGFAAREGRGVAGVDGGDGGGIRGVAGDGVQGGGGGGVGNEGVVVVGEVEEVLHDENVGGCCTATGGLVVGGVSLFGHELCAKTVLVIEFWSFHFVSFCWVLSVSFGVRGTRAGELVKKNTEREELCETLWFCEEERERRRDCVSVC